jgi:hypothetical protein
MKCSKCFKELPEDLDRSENVLMNLGKDNANYHFYMRLFKEKEQGLHEACAEAVIKSEKLEQYEKILGPIFDKLNRSQIKGYDTEAIVTAFFSQHRFLQNEAIIVLKAIIDRIGAKAGDPGYTDPRNQWALDWCKKASNA